MGGETIFTDLVRLEPCGLEPSGEIRHINELSYKPAKGWSSANPMTFAEAEATTELSQQDAVNLAKQCIWRMFRVRMVSVVNEALPGPAIGGYDGEIKERKQITLLPQIYSATKQPNGQPDTSPAYVLGSIYMAKERGVLEGKVDTIFGNSDASSGQRLPRTPQLDGARGLVTFDQQCYYRKQATPADIPVYLAPEIYLYTSMAIRDIVGRKPTKFSRNGSPAEVDAGCPPEIIHHPELALVVRTFRNNADHTTASHSTPRRSSRLVVEVIP